MCGDLGGVRPAEAPFEPSRAAVDRALGCEGAGARDRERLIPRQWDCLIEVSAASWCRWPAASPDERAGTRRGPPGRPRRSSASPAQHGLVVSASGCTARSMPQIARRAGSAGVLPRPLPDLMLGEASARQERGHAWAAVPTNLSAPRPRKGEAPAPFRGSYPPTVAATPWLDRQAKSSMASITRVRTRARGRGWFSRTTRGAPLLGIVRRGQGSYVDVGGGKGGEGSVVETLGPSGVAMSKPTSAAKEEITSSGSVWIRQKWSTRHVGTNWIGAHLRLSHDRG